MAANSLKRYPAKIEKTEMAGVKVEVVTPEAGVARGQEHRVLINLHGGAFVGGAEYCGLVESVPLSSVSGMKIVCVDYRQGWEDVFPAANEDVAAVYAALLNDYAPEQIGLFGYSAGGALAAQALAWFIDRKTPIPGAVAFCSAVLGAGDLNAAGDSDYLAVAAMGDRPPSPPRPDAPPQHRFGYFAGQDSRNPLIAPVSAPEMLAHFPKTLLLTGTRSFDLSASLIAHRALLAAGRVAELHCWEGMWHCFPYNSDMPEAQDAYGALTKFFDDSLAR
jgi:epsilon-lactone hydrolase